MHWWTYSSWAQLVDSAESCSLCALIQRESRHSTAPKGDDRGGIRFTAYGSSRLDVRCVEEQKYAQLNVAFDNADIYRAPTHAKGLFNARIASRQAGDARNVTTIKHWLELCKSTHTRCAAWAKGSIANKMRLPTRVIDVGDPGSNFVKLHIPDESEVADYVALSYCWGRGNPYITKKSNLQQHLDGNIQLEHLPRTLQDAIVLTRKLEVRYIWIDALSIIQDSNEDWLHEASCMSTIYSNALCTIAASSSSDTSMGLFAPRSERHGASVTLPWPLEEPNDGGGPLALHVTPVFGSFKDEMAVSPLAKRGWTFQERALSARIVHFGSELCYWECKEACIGEDEEIGKYSVQDSFFHFKDMLLSSADIPVSKLHDKWAWAISQFSARQLTKSSDCFAALEGVAKIFSDRDRLGKYLCGLWETDFPRHLLWCSDRSQQDTTHTEPKAYRAPSWSWAAVEGPVKNSAIELFFRYSSAGIEMTDELGSDGLYSHKILHIRSVKVETEGPTSFGPVIEAIVHVKGIIYPVRRGGKLRRGEYTIETTDEHIVGSATWDIDHVPDKSTHLWICPVLQRQKIEDGWAVSDCLVLRAAEVNYDGELTFKRVAKGKTTNFWAKTVVIQDFTII